MNTGPAPEDEDDGAAPVAAAELWDLTRPLEGSCLLELKTFDDAEGKMVHMQLRTVQFLQLCLYPTHAVCVCVCV